MTTTLKLKDLIEGKLVIVAISKGNINPEYLRTNGVRDILILDTNGPREAERSDSHVFGRYTRIPDVRKNNCNLAILHGRSTFALFQKRQFARCSHVLISKNLFSSIAILGGLLRYRRRGLLKKAGTVTVEYNGKGKRYIVLKAKVRMQEQARQYGPAGCTPLEILHRLSDCNYVALRSIKSIEDGTHIGDIDILARHADLKNIMNRLHEEVGIYSVDVYTDIGQEGHTYKSVPYYTLHMADGLLDSAQLTDSRIKVPSDHWNYLSFCYHLIFHNKTVKVNPSDSAITEDSFSKPSYHGELMRLAKKAGLPAPSTLEDIENTLKEFHVMPSLDLIGFYSDKDEFLTHRYFSEEPIKVGLATFFIRDFGNSEKKIEILRKRLGEHFDLLAEGPVDDTNRDRIVRGVRGGNWADHNAPGGIAEPIHWFVCWDHSPVPPSKRTRRKHPRVDNERIRLKDELRQDLVDEGQKALRIVHSSDNSTEALDHLELLELMDHPKVITLLFEGE